MAQESLNLWQHVFFAVLWPFGFNHFLRRVVPLVERMRLRKKFLFTWIAF